MRLETDRLILRPFAPEDLNAFAAINADSRVMRFFPAPYDRAQTMKMLEVFAQKQARFGYAFSAVAHKQDGALIGMCGLNRIVDGLPVAPCTEIGWRLAAGAWGEGYASEAATAWLEAGFTRLGLREILAFAPRLNAPSLAVMRRIGMTRAPELDFDHPAIPEGHALRPMELWRVTARRP